MYEEGNIRIMNKEDKKRLLNEYKKRERESFEKSLPMSKNLFVDLFDYLDENLEEYGCQHDFTLTLSFLEDNNCDVDTVIEWLLENGAGCDCEVLFNIEENFED